jgi:hypothetical protein
MRSRSLRSYLLAVVAVGFVGGCASDHGTAAGAADGGRGASLGGSGSGGAAASVASVGKACEPQAVPEGGFDAQEAYLETANMACGGGVCLTYRVAGDPRAACRTRPGACDASDAACTGPVRCSSLTEVEKHVHCSCRCDGPDRNAEYCECPDGLTCTPVLEQGARSIVGSYCVRP